MSFTALVSSLKRSRVRAVSVGAAAVLLAAGGVTVANAVTPASAGGVFYACTNGANVQAATIELNTQPHCSNAQTLTQWNAQGPAGPAGPQGPQGIQGPAGPGTTAFGTNTNTAAAGRAIECYIGEVLLTAGSVAQGTPANGQLLSINQNAALFSLLGTTYGGNGTTNFALPDLRSAAPNNMTYSICTVGVFPSRN
ncbi:tail fiber protein [Sinomonas sp. P10A9]|uniref:Tail fiber protein n=1 Tax=Sinomonas puerhi TaxID=3238584 RepID=A0AB39L1R3_9MICC